MSVAGDRAKIRVSLIKVNPVGMMKDVVVRSCKAFCGGVVG